MAVAAAGGDTIVSWCRVVELELYGMLIYNTAVFVFACF